MRHVALLFSLVFSVAIAVLGTFWVNGALLGILEGQTFRGTYTLTAIDCVAYGCWFGLVGWAGVRWQRIASGQYLSVSAVGIFACLVLERVWLNPAAGSAGVVYYVIAYAPGFMVFPVFWFVWYFAGRKGI